MCVFLLSSTQQLFRSPSNELRKLLLNSHSFHLNKFALFEFSGFEKWKENFLFLSLSKSSLLFPYFYVFARHAAREESDFPRHPFAKAFLFSLFPHREMRIINIFFLSSYATTLNKDILRVYMCVRIHSSCVLFIPLKICTLCAARLPEPISTSILPEWKSMIEFFFFRLYIFFCRVGGSPLQCERKMCLSRAWILNFHRFAKMQLEISFRHDYFSMILISRSTVRSWWHLIVTNVSFAFLCAAAAAVHGNPYLMYFAATIKT